MLPRPLASSSFSSSIRMACALWRCGVNIILPIFNFQFSILVGRAHCPQRAVPPLAPLLGLLALLASLPSPAQFTSISTLAGYGGNGSQNAVGSSARFFQPQGVAGDASGNLYVADTLNHTIRKIAPDGTVTNLAGLAGVNGSADGQGSAARFNQPFGIAVDTAGTVYVGDFGNNTIRKITPAGLVSTLAGLAGTRGTNNGSGTNALFNQPAGVAVDTAFNVYVADYGNSVIRKITAVGAVSTLAGTPGVTGTNNGAGAGAQFYQPLGVAVDVAVNVYVADTANHAIRKINVAGTVSTLAGVPGTFGNADGPVGTGQFYQPQGIAVDSSGNIYVADTFNNTIRKVTSAGATATIAGQAAAFGAADGTNTTARFWAPIGVAVSATNIIIADSGNGTIRKTTQTGPNWVTTTFVGSPSIGSADGAGTSARFYRPLCIAAGNGALYVADSQNSTIRKITLGGPAAGTSVSTLAGSAGVVGSANGSGTNALFYSPQAVTVDSSSNVYVADTLNSVIRKTDSSGAVTTFAGTVGDIGSGDSASGAVQFNQPAGITIDGAGNIFVADSGNHTIRQITPAGVASTLAGLAGAPGGMDGTNSKARFFFPMGLATDGGGNVYVADFFNNTIRKVTPSGLVTTIAGLAGTWGSADGANSTARFLRPRGVFVDSAGHVFVADSGNQLLRIIVQSGTNWTVTTLAGFPSVSGATDGLKPAAQFCYPSGVALNAAGYIYVADSGNNTIRIVPPWNPPLAPSNLTATGISTSRVDLVWSDNATNEAGFIVGRGTNVAGPFVDLPATGINATNYTDTGLTANTTYYYVVRAFNDSGPSSNSAVASATTLPVGPTLLLQPQSQSVFLNHPASFTVTSSGNPPFGYEWRFNGTNINGATASSFSIPSAGYADGGLYSVVVSNGGGIATSTNAVLTILTIASSGNNAFGQLAVPPQATNAIAIAAGGWHSLALLPSGTVLAWGNNFNGQCDVPPSLTDAVAIAAGGYHSLAIKADGTLLAWGANDYGQSSIPGNAKNVLAVAAGRWHTLALLEDGSVVAWGDNGSGQTNVPPGLTKAIAIAAAGNHSLALCADGTVLAWGDNTDSNGFYAGESDVPNDLSGALTIAAGDYHSVAQTSSSNIVSWGDNSLGQCSPPPLSGVATIIGGGQFNLALNFNGTGLGWGDNSQGQYNLFAGLSDIVALAAGERHSLALFDNGAFHPRLFNVNWNGARFKARVQSRARKTYALEYKDSLSTNTWTALATNRGNGALLLFTDPAASGTQRFYRVREW